MRDGPLLSEPQPIDATLVRSLFADLADAPRLLLAVSGGADSTALMHLAARWAREEPGRPALAVATVDHGLRADSAAEAAFVGREAEALGLPHAVLPWPEPRPSTRLQERAREARYTLLARQAAAVGAPFVLTAHHLDDQAETVLMRLAHGSGLGGLGGMRRRVGLAPGVTLARPFLELPKAALLACCHREAWPYCDDPSNRDEAYDRTRLRAAAPALARIGIGAPDLQRFARRMARAETALQAAARRWEDDLSPDRDAEHYAVRLPSEPDPELLIRLLRRALASTAPEATPPRLEGLERLAEALGAARATGRAHKGTLGGVEVALGADGRLSLRREPPRRSRPTGD